MAFSPAWNKFRTAFSVALLDAGKMVSRRGETELLQAADEWLEKTDSEWPKSESLAFSTGGDDMHPWYTGTLHDSISIRIAENMRTIGLRFMPRAAIANQTATAEDAGRDYDNIRGYIEARLVAGRAGGVRQQGLQSQLFIGAPYAQKVNEMPEHSGFIENLQKDFVGAMRQRMQSLGKHAYKVRAR